MRSPLKWINQNITPRVKDGYAIFPNAPLKFLIVPVWILVIIFIGFPLLVIGGIFSPLYNYFFTRMPFDEIMADSFMLLAAPPYFFYIIGLILMKRVQLENTATRNIITLSKKSPDLPKSARLNLDIIKIKFESCTLKDVNRGSGDTFQLAQNYQFFPIGIRQFNIYEIELLIFSGLDPTGVYSLEGELSRISEERYMTPNGPERRITYCLKSDVTFTREN